VEEPAHRTYTLSERDTAALEETIATMVEQIRSGEAWRLPPHPPRRKGGGEEAWFALATLLANELSRS
jgi:hypothetical protein